MITTSQVRFQSYSKKK